jgi:Outer membrane protein beta-barrel domain
MRSRCPDYAAVSAITVEKTNAGEESSLLCMISVRSILIICFSSAFLAPAAFAQFGQDSRFTMHVGGGPTVTSARASDYMSNGYNFLIGGGVRASRFVEILAEYSFNDLGVQDSVLQELTVPDGNARLHSVTGNIKLNLIPGPVNVYVIGGGGWYRRTVEFTEPTTGIVTIFDPWWGVFASAVVPANQVLGSVTRDAGGFNAGGGISVSLGEGVRVFAESRWHRAYHNPTNTTIIPITFGLRF